MSLTCNGRLEEWKFPWMNLKSANKQQQREKVTEIKLRIPREKLFAGLPFEFLLLYCKMIKELQWSDVWKYSAYRRLFRNLTHCWDYTYDGRFHWKVGAMWNGEDIYIRRCGRRSEHENTFTESSSSQTTCSWVSAKNETFYKPPNIRKFCPPKLNNSNEITIRWNLITSSPSPDLPAHLQPISRPSSSSSDLPANLHSISKPSSSSPAHP
ncbi:unnamed protein product [Orchesella dallaii]|uniref:Uncharacterized protein n=1 Tax=Orchesella dallaii TaxID=48710 RepID=A0ABP1RNL0_9HEXA